MHKLALAFVLTCSLLLSGASPFAVEIEGLLDGLSQISVIVEDLPDDCVDLGISRQHLQNTIELSLRSSGVMVPEIADAFLHLGLSCLRIDDFHFDIRNRLAHRANAQFDWIIRAGLRNQWRRFCLTVTDRDLASAHVRCHSLHQFDRAGTAGHDAST